MVICEEPKKNIIHELEEEMGEIGSRGDYSRGQLVFSSCLFLSQQKLMSVKKEFAEVLESRPNSTSWKSKLYQKIIASILNNCTKKMSAQQGEKV